MRGNFFNAVFGSAVAGAVIAGIKKTKEWEPPPEADKYLQIFAKVERENRIPAKLLLRVAYQESRFRGDIITGSLKSSAGAVGIMQIVPRWHPNVDPLNEVEAIKYAGKYLSKLNRRFGSWSDALAAYNWGQGNLSRFKRGEIRKMPLETRSYIKEITKDVRVV